MVSEDFKVGDLVWAKMKGYPPWPARIAEPPCDTKPPKNKKSHFVYFFGTNNFAWILNENISLHKEDILLTLNKKKTGAYQSAVDALISYSKSTKKEKSPKIKKTENDKKSQTKVVKVINSIPKKHERKVLTHKPPLKKVYKKRPLVNDINGESSACSPSKSRKLHIRDYSPVSNLSSVATDCSSSDNSNRTFFEGGLNTSNEALKRKHVKPSPKKFGFIGLGHLGGAIVKILIEAGHDITVWNKTTYKCDAFEKMGATRALSPSDLIVECDVTFCCVSEPDASKALVFGEKGILKGLERAEKLSKGPKGYVEMTSIDAETSQAICEAVSMKRGIYLEAPMCGSSKNAEEGSLLILAAGDRKLFSECETCFHAIGKHAYYIGCEIGLGAKMNLMLSMISGNIYVALAEAIVLAEKLDLSKKDFLNILKLGPLHCDKILEKGQMMLERAFKTVTPLKHVQKDLTLSLMMANKINQPLPITSAVHQIYTSATRRKYGDSDVSAVFQVVRF